MNRVITRSNIIKTFEINGIKKLEDIISSKCYHCQLNFDDENLELIGYFPNAIKRKIDEKEETINFYSNTDFPISFETAVIINMCTKCINELKIKKNSLMIPINHNGDFYNDYYLWWDFRKNYSSKKLKTMENLVFRTLAIDFVPHSLTQMDIRMGAFDSGYIELKNTPYLNEATETERSLYREIRELRAWSDNLKKTKDKLRDAGLIIVFLFFVYIFITIIVKNLFI